MPSKDPGTLSSIDLLTTLFALSQSLDLVLFSNQYPPQLFFPAVCFPGDERASNQLPLDVHAAVVFPPLYLDGLQSAGVDL